MSPKHGPLSGGSAHRLPVKKGTGSARVSTEVWVGGRGEGEGGRGTVSSELSIYLTGSEIRYSILDF